MRTCWLKILTNIFYLINACSIDEPQNFKEAMSCKLSNEWKCAADKEHYMESSRKRGSQSREENLIVSWGVVDSLVVVVDNLVGVFDSFVGVVDSIMGVFDTINYPHETINYPHKTINNPHYTIKYPYKTINYPHKTINYPHETIKYPTKLSTTPHETIKFSSCDYLPCLRELSKYFFILLFQKKSYLMFFL